MNDISNLHEPLQSAYKACHSTETALIRVQNDILSALDNKGAAILVLLDLSAAFDTIDHSILLTRMETMLGVKGLALDWFRSYLLEQTQCIKIKDTLSDGQELKWAVPQGYVLGALLFLTYILPLAQLIKYYGLDTHGYADDSQLYVTFRKTNDTAAVQHQVKNLEQCLCDINTWMAQNMLKLNNGKTEIILFGSKKQLAKVNIQSLDVAGTRVNVSEPVRNLGAMFDSNFTMVSHVNSFVKKASFHLRNIGKVRKLPTKDATKKVMQNLVISQINYCNALLSGTQQDTKMQRLQNQAARIVTRTKWHKHNTPVLEHLHWFPVKFRIDFKILLMVFKAINGLAPEYVSELSAIYEPACPRWEIKPFQTIHHASGISCHRKSKLLHQFRLLKRTLKPICSRRLFTENF